MPCRRYNDVTVCFRRCHASPFLPLQFAVIIVGSVTASNDFSKQLKFAELSKESAGAVEIRVVRGGAETTVGPEDVLVGDLIKIDTGAKLPADGLLLRGDIKTNESALTGESDEIRKNPETAPVLLSGTYVTAGTGLYLVTAIGTRSLQGQIMKVRRALDVAAWLGHAVAPSSASAAAVLLTRTCRDVASLCCLCSLFGCVCSPAGDGVRGGGDAAAEEAGQVGHAGESAVRLSHCCCLARCLAHAVAVLLRRDGHISVGSL